MAEAAKAEPVILGQIRRAREEAGLAFRVQFALVWIVLIGALGAGLYATGNINVDFIAEWGPFILEGTRTTILVCVTSIALAVMFALLGALGRLSSNAIIYATASLYVSLVRGTPLLVQLLFIYLGLPQVGIVLDPLVGGILGLGFNYGAYMTEVFRAGIQAVPRGQREAAQALGMTEALIMRRIVLPQAFRIVIPAIGNEFIAMIKDSSLVSIVTVTELLWRAQRAGGPRFRTLEALLIAAAIYWILTIVFSFFQERLERRMARGDR